MKEITDLEKAAECFRKRAEQNLGEAVKAINDFYELYLGKMQKIVDENKALTKEIEELNDAVKEAEKEANRETRASRA